MAPEPPGTTGALDAVHAVAVDGQLARAAGDAGADFSAFVTAHGSTLLRHAYLLSGSRSDAEELVQETLERVYLHWERVAAGGAPLAYTKTAIARRHVSRWRSLTRRRVYEQRAGLDRALWDEPGVDPGSDELDELDEREAMWDLLSTIAPRQRAAIVLRYYEQLSEAEIAQVLGISPGTVKSSISRGLAALRVTASRDSDARPGRGGTQ